jgi:hypothetical protein
MIVNRVRAWHPLAGERPARINPAGIDPQKTLLKTNN